MMKTLISILVIFFSPYLFAEVKIYEDIPEDKKFWNNDGFIICTNTGKENKNCSENNARHNLKFVKYFNYYSLKSDEGYCLNIGFPISIEKCKFSDDKILLMPEIISQKNGCVKFAIKGIKNDRYIREDLEYDELTRTGSINYAKNFIFCDDPKKI